jgi:hypothetical protein
MLKNSRSLVLSSMSNEMPDKRSLGVTDFSKASAFLSNSLLGVLLGLR